MPLVVIYKYTREMVGRGESLSKDQLGLYRRLQKGNHKKRQEKKGVKYISQTYGNTNKFRTYVSLDVKWTPCEFLGYW